MAGELLPVPGLSRLERWSERTNPVLVKEVRSALRGRTFMIGFVILLMLALLVSTIAMVASTSADGIPSGTGYLGAVSTVFMLGTMLLVPFMAMAAMSAEHEESALEMLQLSGLAPGRVVLGKLAGAAVQASLIYSACLPFLAFAFLLPGTDLVELLMGLVTMLASCMAFLSIGILLGATLRARWVRVFGYVFLAIVIFMSMGLPSLLIFGRAMGGASMTSWVWTFLLPLAISGLTIALCCVHATSRLQHAEENRSTPYRVVGTTALLVACAFGLVLATGALAAWRFGTQDAWRTVGALALVEAWLFVVLLLPVGVLARHLDRPWIQGLARVATLVMPVFFVILPTLGMFIAGSAAGSFAHAGNPAHLPGAFLETGAVRDFTSLVILLVGVCFALALNVPRVLRSTHDLTRRRSQRPASEGKHAASQP